MAHEPDLRPPPSANKEPDWDKLDATYEAPGAAGGAGIHESTCSLRKG